MTFFSDMFGRARNERLCVVCVSSARSRLWTRACKWFFHAQTILYKICNKTKSNDNLHVFCIAVNSFPPLFRWHSVCGACAIEINIRCTVFFHLDGSILHRLQHMCVRGAYFDTLLLTAFLCAIFHTNILIIIRHVCKRSSHEFYYSFSFWILQLTLAAAHLTCVIFLFLPCISFIFYSTYLWCLFIHRFTFYFCCARVLLLHRLLFRFSSFLIFFHLKSAYSLLLVYN